MANPVCFQSLEEEMRGIVPYMGGRLLNIGCGDADLTGFIKANSPTAMVVNADIATSLPDGVICSIFDLPFADQTFDSVLCNAVLEHVPQPFTAVAELDLVLKPGGRLLLCVPFLQPFHASPTDYFRYTAAGLRALCPDTYEVAHLQTVHCMAQTIGWLVWEFVNEKGGRLRKALVWPWIWLFTRLFQGTDLNTTRSANGFQMVLIKR